MGPNRVEQRIAFEPRVARKPGVCGSPQPLDRPIWLPELARTPCRFGGSHGDRAGSARRRFSGAALLHRSRPARRASPPAMPATGPESPVGNLPRGARASPRSSCSRARSTTLRQATSADRHPRPARPRPASCSACLNRLSYNAVRPQFRAASRRDFGLAASPARAA